MAANIAFNYLPTTNAQGSFNAQSVGWVQGQFIDDPAIRYQLAGGVLASTETLPMWGGVGISETVTPNGTNGPDGSLGGLITRATNVTAAASGQLTGFSVFNQAYGMAITPQSPVPLAPSYGQVNFFRLGSNARIVVAAAPTLVSLETGVITQQVSWDFISQQLVPYSAAYNAVTITGATWANTSGGRTTFTVGTDLTAVLAANDLIDVSGVVSTGGTGVGYNGLFSVVSVGSTTVVVTQVSASSPGTYSSGGTIAAGGGALACQVLSVEAGNSMTVSYNASTGYATWNYNGTVAVIKI